MADDEVKLRLSIEHLQWKKTWAETRAQTARDMAAIRTTVANSLSQTRINTAQQLAQIRVNAATQLNQMRQTAQRTLASMGSQFESAGRRLSAGLTLPLVALAAASASAAKEVDAQRNKLIAFEGSIEAANVRLQRNQALANRSVGVTRALANESFALFKGLRGVTDETIEKTIAGVGRLNAVFSIPDLDKFQQNLGQIFNLDFSTKDIREARRAVPIFDQLLESAFGTSDPTALRKLKASGKLTIDTFLSGLADAVEQDSRLSKVQEAIGTRLTKIGERVQLAFAPLGDAILTLAEKALNVLEPALTAISNGFASLPASAQTVIVLIGGVAAAIGPLLLLAGSLISTIGALREAYITLNTLGLIPTISNLRALGPAMQATATGAAVSAAGVAGLAAAILAAVAASLAITRAIDGYAESLKESYPWLVKFTQATLTAFNPLYGLLKGLGLIGPETKKVGEAQAAAVAPIKAFTEAVEEESATLKQLKRALEEVEIATRSRLAAAQRAYNEERISLQQSTATQIDALLTGQKAQLAVIDQGIKESQDRLKALEQSAPQGLGPHGADDKDAKAEREKLESLLLDRVKITTETFNQILDLQSQQRIKERELEEQQGDALLSVQRTQAERQIDALRDAAEQNESLRLNSERKIVEIERRTTDAEVAEIRRRVSAAAAGTEARAQLENELSRKLAESGRQRAEQARRVARAALEAALLPVRRGQKQEGLFAASDEGTVARLKDLADRNLLSAAESEARIGRIVDESFARRVKSLRDEITVRVKHNQDVSELNAQLAQLEQERLNAQSGTGRAIQAGMEEDLDKAQSYRDRLASIRQNIAETVIGTRELLLDIARRAIELRRPLNVEERREEVNHQADLAHVKLAARQASVLGEIQDEINRLERKKTLNAQEVEQLKELHRQLRAEEERFKAESEAIEQGRTEGLEEAGSTGLFGPIRDEWEKFKKSLADTSAVEIFAQTIGQAFSNVREAVLGAVDAMIFSGKSLKAALAEAFRNALAQTAAFLAKKAYMKALEALAEAAMHFAALDFAGGVRYLAAAAAWGALGTGVAALGRAAAGRGSAGALADSGSSASGSSTANSTTERDRTINEPRRGGMSDPNQAAVMGYMMVDVKHDDGHTERQMVRVWRRMGEFRDTVMASTVGTAPSHT